MADDAEKRSELFTRLRKHLLETPVDDTKDKLPPLFGELIDRFERCVGEIVVTEASEAVLLDASEYLREIAFMDGCLGARQRRALGARLLAIWLLATRGLKPTTRKRLLDVFQTAPAADYFLAYALAWQLGWFDDWSSPDPTAGQPAKTDQAKEGEPRRLKIISLHSVKGGTGKSLLAQLYGRACAAKGKKVVIVDLDFTGPTLQFLGTVGTDFPPPLEPAFPLFFGDVLPLFDRDSELRKLGDDAAAPDNIEALAEHLNDKLNREPLARFRCLPFSLTTRTLEENNGASQELKDGWKQVLSRCRIKSKFLPTSAPPLESVVLPHRPEFLRRAGRLLQSPDWQEWGLVQAWLEWLLDELRGEFEVVVLDNAPGISNTAVIMDLVWGLDSTVSVSDRAVCVVSTPRSADLANTAYELLWIQASAKSQRRVYWIGNMWGKDTPKLEAMVAYGELPCLSLRSEASSGTSDLVHTTPATAQFLAGLTAEDLQRIKTVLAVAVAAPSRRLVCSDVQFRKDLRRLFDFDVKRADLPLPPSLAKLLISLCGQEPLRTILRDSTQ